MAIKLNEFAHRCEELLREEGAHTPNSSMRLSMFGISARWRRLAQATKFKDESLPIWTEQEVEAAEIIISTLSYLERIGCTHVEKLLRDVIKRHEMN